MKRKNCAGWGESEIGSASSREWVNPFTRGFGKVSGGILSRYGGMYMSLRLNHGVVEGIPVWRFRGMTERRVASFSIYTEQGAW